jgi:hypothetical protein
MSPNVLPLTTVEDVLTYPGMASLQVADKEWIGHLISMFSVRAESYVNRLFFEEERTQSFSSDGTICSIQLPAFGRSTNAVASVSQALDRIHSQSTIIDPSGFYFDWQTGILSYDYGPFIRGRGTIQVKWTGGLGTTPEHVPDDIRAVATMQVCYWWQRRNEIGVEERRFKEGAIIKVPTKMAFIADVEDVLESYKVYVAS